MTDEEREDLNTFKHDLVKRARWWQWKAEALEKGNEQLKSENAALRERLEKAVELPCKVGDTVYMPWTWGGTSGIANLKVCYITLFEGEFLCDTDLESDDIDYKRKYNFGQFREYDFGLKVFITREAAEARLAELKGETK